VAESLILGRQRGYFKAQFFNAGLENAAAVDSGRLRRYVDAYRSPAQLRAGLGQYRATRANAAFNRNHRERIDLPMALIGGTKGIGRGLEPMAADLRANGWSRVTLEILSGAHYLLDENAPDIASAIEKHARWPSD
jgi:hypothetical protein